jgi:hypothetical protein
LVPTELISSNFIYITISLHYVDNPGGDHGIHSVYTLSKFLVLKDTSQFLLLGYNIFFCTGLEFLLANCWLQSGQFLHMIQCKNGTFNISTPTQRIKIVHAWSQLHVRVLVVHVQEFWNLTQKLTCSLSLNCNHHLATTYASVGACS